MEKLNTQEQYPPIWDELEALLDPSWKDELTEGTLEYEIKEILVGFESRAKLEEVLQKLSTQSDAQIATLWENKHLKKHLRTFTRRFKKSQHFLKYPREIGASIRVLSEADRMKEIEWILSEGELMNEKSALRLFYLMQGLTDNDDSSDTQLEAMLKNPAYQKDFERFQAVLNNDDVERFTSGLKEFSDSQNRTPADQDKIDALNSEVDMLYQEILHDISSMKLNKTQKHQDRKIRKANRKAQKGKSDKIDVTKDEAKKAYETLQSRSGAIITLFEEKYPDLFEVIVEALPLSVITDPNFGLQTGVDMDETDESIAQFKILDVLARPYQLLLADPDRLWVMAFQISAGKTDFDGAKAFMTNELNAITPDPTWKFETDMLYSPSVYQPMHMDRPELLITDDRDEISENDQKALIYSKTEQLFQNRLSFEKNAALLKMSEDTELIKSVLEKGALYQELTATDDPMDYYDQLYFGAKGLLQEIQRSDLWASTDSSTIRLVVSMIVNANLGQAANDLLYQNTLSTEAEEILKEFGFDRTIGYQKANSTAKGKQDIPDKGHGNLRLAWEIVKDQWQDQGPKPGFFKRIGKIFNLIRGGIYFAEGYLNLPDINKGANIEGLSLTDMQDFFGGHFYGLELETDQSKVESGYIDFKEAMGLSGKATQASGDLDIRVQERLGRIDASAFYLPLASIAMDLGDMTVKSDEGYFGGFVVDLSYETKGLLAQEVPATPTIIKLDQMELSNLQIVYKDEIYAIGGLGVKGLKITSNQPMGSFDEMRNWSVLMDTVIDFFYNVFMGLLDATMTSVTSFLPDLEKDTALTGGKTADQELSELLYNAFGEKFDINLSYDEIVMNDFISSTMGRIGNVSIADGDFGLKHDLVNNEVVSTIGADKMAINEVDISGVSTDKIESGKFSLKSHFDSPGGANVGAQVSQLTHAYSNQPIPPSKLKKLEFDFASLKSTPIDFMGDEVNVPFNEIRGYAEFSAAGDLLTIQIDYLDQLDFLKLPTKKGDNLYFEKTPNSEFVGKGVSLKVDIGLNEVFDQKINGLIPQWMHIQDIHFDTVTGHDFVMVYGGYRFDLSSKDDASDNAMRKTTDGILNFTDVNLTNTYLERKVDKDTGDKSYQMGSLGKLTAATSNIQGLIADFADGLSMNFDEFDTRGMLTIEQITNSSGDEIFDVTALRATTKGSYNVDHGKDKDKSLIEFEVSQETKLHGAYNATTGALSLNDFTIPEIWLPTINWYSDDMSKHISATDTRGTRTDSTEGVFLRGITPDVTIVFNQSKDKDEREAQPYKSFEVKSLKIDEIISNGINVDWGKGTNINIPKNKKVTIKGAFLENMKMVSELEWVTKDDEVIPKVTWERENMYNADGDYQAAKTGVSSVDIPEGVTFTIKEKLKGDMDAITSGEMWFELLEGDGYKYSATNLDGGGLITNQYEFDKGMLDKWLDFDMDSNLIAGSYMTGVEKDGRKYKEYQQTFDFPRVDINGAFFLNDNETMRMSIPKTGKSFFENLVGSATVRVTEATEAAKEAAKLKREAALATENKSRTTYEKVLERMDETVTAPPDITLTIDNLDIATAEIYEMDLIFWKHGERLYDSRFERNESHIKLRKDEAAILRKLHIAGLTAFIPGEEGQKAVMSVKEDGAFTLGGTDEEGNLVRGLEVGQAGFSYVNQWLWLVLAGTYQRGWQTISHGNYMSKQDPEGEVNTEASFQLDSFSFSGSTDGEYDITIKKPSGDLHEIIDMEDGFSSTDIFVTDGNIEPNIEVRNATDNSNILKADEVIVTNRLIDEDDPDKGYRRVTKIINPVLGKIRIDNIAPIPGKFENMILSGKVEGILEITENTDVNMAPRQELIAGEDYKQQGGTIIKATNEAGDSNTATITVESLEWQTPFDPSYTDEYGVEGTDDYNFLNACTGNISLSLFGTEFNLPVEEITYTDPDSGAVVTEAGWVELGPLIAQIGDFFTGHTWGRPDWILGDLEAGAWRDDGTEYGAFARLVDPGLWDGDGLPWEYIIRSEEFGFLKVRTLLRKAERNLANIDGRVMARLAKIVDSQVHHDGSQTQLDDWGYTEETMRQFRVWMNRADNALNPEIEMDLQIDLNRLEKDEKSRGMANIFTGDETIDINTELHFDQTITSRTGMGGVGTRDLDLIAEMDELKLPKFRLPIGGKDEEGNDQAAKAIISGAGMDISELSAEEVGGVHDIKAEKIVIEGFKIELPPKKK